MSEAGLLTSRLNRVLSPSRIH